MSKKNLVPLDLRASYEKIKFRHEVLGEPHKVLSAKEIDETRGMIEAAANFKPVTNRMLTTEQAADCLGVTGQTLRNWEARGILIPADKTEKGHRRYTEQQIVDFKKKQMVVQQILIPDIKPRDMVSKIEQFMSGFDPNQTVDVTIQVDEAARKVSFVVTSEDGMTSQRKTLKMED